MYDMVCEVGLRWGSRREILVGRGAEAILQLRAEVFSETRPLEAYWIDRCRKTTGERRQKATISVSA